MAGSRHRGRLVVVILVGAVAAELLTAGHTALTLATDLSVLHTIQNEDHRRFCEKIRSKEEKLFQKWHSDTKPFWEKWWYVHELLIRASGSRALKLNEEQS